MKKLSYCKSAGISLPDSSQVDGKNLNKAFQSRREDALKNLPKPPGIIQNLDLLANLPPKTNDESEDEYEVFDNDLEHNNFSENIDHRNHSLENVCNRSGSLLNNSCCEEGDEVYEIYESITESVRIEFLYFWGEKI